MNPDASVTASLRIERPDDGTLIFALAGSWRTSADRSAAAPALAEIGRSSPRRVILRDDGLQAWDSALLVFVRAAAAQARLCGAAFDASHLPEGLRRLLALADAVPERTGPQSAPPAPWIERLGQGVLRAAHDTAGSVRFVGELVLALAAWTRGRARYRHRDLFSTLQECGPGALPIISLISVLVGMILAFLGSVQLKLFGVEIFIADAVAIGMAREMGALMTGILMAGRTGAAFAARLGTMQVNEEIDALRTLGFSPMEFLVLPRVLALVLMMPLLTIYADLLGILGGAAVGIGMLDLSPAQYYHQTVNAIDARAILAGLVKSAVFGVLVAFSGCLQGIRCGRSASAVGEATTAAVVNAIVYIVVADALLSVIYVVTGF